jgi:hypothetical protein
MGKKRNAHRVLLRNLKGRDHVEVVGICER